jgi:tetratricopeptide (TPR) repeat protein
MNVEGYPRSANAYDSLSDAWLAAGDKEQALKYAQKAIAMLDQDPNATPQFKQLVRESAQAKIKQLQGDRK